MSQLDRNTQIIDLQHSDWLSVDDVVMGGRSASQIEILRDGLRFHGELSLENGGGFASIRAARRGGELVTRPLRFDGGQLSANFATSAAGGMRVEIQDAEGRPIPGFALADCHVLFGDTIDRTIAWQSGSDVSQLAGRAVRLRFELQDADLYSYQFTSEAG